MTSVKLFLKGTIVLVLAAFVGECAEFLINMILARELGEGGMGQYMTILPLVFLIMMLASFELPVSLSKLVAEKESKYHQKLLRDVLHLTIILTAALLVLAALIMPNISIFQDNHPALKWIVLSMIPMMSFTSIARGYFMGKQHMGKIAVANLLRRLIMLLLLAAVYQFFEFERPTALLIAFVTLAASELVVFVYLFHLFLLNYQNLKRVPGEDVNKTEIRKSLLAISGPTTALRIFHSLTHAAQPFLIKTAIIHAGVPPEAANEQFGMLAGVAMTIGFFPAFIAHSFMIVLIPTVAKQYAGGELVKLQRLLQHVMLLTLLYGVPAVAVFYFFAEPLTNLFFHSNNAAYFLQILWPYFLLHFFVIPMQAYLLGLGLVKDAFYHTIWATIVSFTIIYILGSRPEWQMSGVIIGMNTGTVLMTLMHLLTVLKRIGVVFPTRSAERKVFK
ncbi:Membrane protein involved in the export of O-antigen and teichoic acid [Mesobacillus persicus]|uniref:Membrane protein involved in the export of O-antigen and teichoic acid n=1 Tax=Mesobacillus persicus TaxID=930146 RepID=A0A1H8CLE0_9BACI|nr:Membrane protein involved in the export of O-antigen and teichoic acid [Mesobacillus persicus]